MTHVEPLPQPARTVAAGRDAGGFQGSFTLRFKVECAGQTLDLAILVRVQAPEPIFS
jgi:hypothetical protein